MKKEKLKKKLKKTISLLNQILEKLGDTIINEDKLESYTSVKLEKPKKKK